MNGQKTDSILDSAVQETETIIRIGTINEQAKIIKVIEYDKKTRSISKITIPMCKAEWNGYFVVLPML